MQAAGKRLEAYRHGLLDTIEGEFDEEVEDAADIYELDPVDLADRVSVLRYRAQNERKIPEPPSEANTAPSTTEPEPVKKELTSEPEQ
ncbi:MAG: hypothetical protein LBU88_01720 [Treponema sp.]|nr:hypothetical protein [Treponema sp.]